MKHTPRVNRSSLNGGSADNRTITISFIGSVLIHGTLMALLFVGFDHTPRISMAPSAINVTMISTRDLPPPPPPPAVKVKTANLSPKSSQQAEAPAVVEEELPAGEPDGQEEEAPAVEEPVEPAVPEPPAEEPETAAPEPTPPPEPEVKKAALKKPAELPEPIPPPTAKEQVVLKEKVVIEDAPKEAEKVKPKPEKPVEKAKTTEEKPKTDEVASGDTEAATQAKAAEPKLIKSSAKNRKAGNDQKSVITPSAARQESIKDAIDKVKAKRGAGGQGTGSAVAANTGGAAGGAAGTAGEAGQSGGVAGGTGRAGGLIGGTGKGGGISGSINDIYKAQISYQIERNWAFSSNLAGGRKDLRTILVITILPSGEIQNPRYEQRSGNSFLDQSAYNAVMKSNPLPPLPRGLSEYTIALVFTPTGLN